MDSSIAFFDSSLTGSADFHRFGIIRSISRRSKHGSTPFWDWCRRNVARSTRNTKFYKLGCEALSFGSRTAVVANVWESQVASRSSSSESSADEDFLTSSQLPVPAEDFFKSVSQEGYPRTSGETAKVQPWRALWDGPQQPSKDGKLIVACPQTCTYGRQTRFQHVYLLRRPAV